ncbi:hypothetical protein [Clostridium cochlearium]|uniref:Uncharacterized protein n=1 Tax=Clostridium cochlearium TaxID=1494 RepID=A0A2X2VUC6_CLOCO|nr:hypothetical protein [Clostridium cochlearium]SQB34582.1 Uncharacterised protein [Clostridium cochlearium]
MNNNTSNFKINKYYFEKKKEKIQNLNEKSKQYIENIHKLEQKIKNKREEVGKLKEEYEELKEKYNRFINIFNERGITLNIVNKDYGLKEWDNLYFKRQGDIGFIITRYGTVVKSFDKNIADILEEILQEKESSIVITRITTNLIKAQLHIR